jgi:hypothetical protein
MEIAKIPRFKNPADFTPADFLAAQRGADPPETDEYVQARRDALADAGLADEGEHEGSNTDDTNLSSAEYLKRIQGA